MASRRRAGLVVSVWMVFFVLVAVFGVVLNVSLVKGDSGTIHIKADGSIDPSDAPVSTLDNVTYTLTDNITSSGDGIIVERDNIIIDGDGCMLQGSGMSKGFVLSGINNVTVRRTSIQRFGSGIYFDGSSNITLSFNTIVSNYGSGIYISNSVNNSIFDNTISKNDEQATVWLLSSSNNSIYRNNITENGAGGIGLYESSLNNLYENNIANNVMWGIDLRLASFNIIIGNNITNNRYGLSLWGENNVLKNNSMVGNSYNFGGSYGSVQDIDSSNTVNGKPIYYWVNRQNMEVPSDAGYVALINSNNITVEGLKLENNDPCVLLAFTTKSQITNNIIKNSTIGIALFSSSNNSLSNNVIEYAGYGINLQNSSYNTLSSNNVANADSAGIYLYQSSFNNISASCITDNGNIGIDISSSSNNNIISGNNITNNGYLGQVLYPSAILLYESSNNKFYHNNFINNSLQVFSYYSVDVWDDGYPSGGNYWSDYTGADLFVGLYQNETGSDGIGDTLYIIDTNNQDQYPLINPWIPGSPISYFSYSPKFPRISETLTFNASASYDYEGSILNFTWNFGDGNLTTVTTSIITHVYTAEGIYTVNLTVIDNDGLSRSVTKSVMVDSTPPIVGIPSHEPADEVQPNQAVKVSVNVTDIISQVINVTLYYSLDNGTTWEEPIPMNYNSSTSLYEATIPGQDAETLVRFKIVAYDYAGNNATFGETEPYCTYQVIPEFPPSLILPLLILTTLITTILSSKKKKTKIPTTSSPTEAFLNFSVILP